MGTPIARSPGASTCRPIASATGEDASASRNSRGSRIERGQVVRAVFAPEEVAEVKAIACELPKAQGVALSRFSRSELHRFVVERGVSQASASTIGRWLHQDAIKPWQHRSWIFPKDPHFLEKAGPVLDLYEGRWEGKLLEPGDFVICADAKPSIQARRRIHESAPPGPGGHGQLVEHEYERMGSVCYLDAWDVRRGKAFGRSEPKGGIEPFDRLVGQVMTKEPYASARRVFWIVDNGSDHRGQRAIDRLQGRWPNLTSSTCPSTPAGSTKSRSTTRSSSARCSTPTTSRPPARSPARSTSSNTATTRSPSPSPGTSPAKTSPN